MLTLLSDNINNGLLFIYGLIAIVIVLIIVIIIMDKVDSKKRKKRVSLADTMNMKPVKDDDFEDTEIIDIVSISSKNKVVNIDDIEKIGKDYSKQEEEILKENHIEPEEIEEDFIESEPELEKTQAQLRVEQITKALEDAGVDEQIEKDKYAKFEEEQEKNAFISYEELKNNYDRLYEENEKAQYADDSTIPINISELKELAKEELKEIPVIEKEPEVLKEEPIIEKKPEVIEELPTIEEVKVEELEELDEFPTIKEETIETLDFDDELEGKHIRIETLEEDEELTKSPYISPVYGIQRPVEITPIEADKEVKGANSFLNNLKELRDNLE